MIKRFAGTTILAVGLLVLLAAPALAFTDVPGSHPNYEAITALHDWGVIEGFADGTFGPDDGVKRAQFAKMAAGMLNIEVIEGMSSPFTDLGANDATLYPHEFVAAAYKHGITRGVTTSTYNPWAYITRAQAITMSVRAMQNLYPGELDSSVYEFYSPWGQFSPDHWQNAAIANSNGLYSNLPDYEQLSPWDRMPREEVTQLLYNLQNYLPPKEVVGSYGHAHESAGIRFSAESPEQIMPMYEWDQPEAGHKFVGFYVSFENVGRGTATVWEDDFFLVDTDGRKYEDQPFGGVAGYDHLGYEPSLTPGMLLGGLVVFEVPESTVVGKLVYDEDSYDYTNYAWR